MRNGDAMRLSVIIPAFNEEDTIDDIIERVRSVDLGGAQLEVVVVDDASTDGTRERLQKYSDDPEICVLRHETNQGKGSAIRTGIERVTGDLVIIQDADLEYDPGDYPRLAEPILNGRADVVYGSRFRGSVEGMALPNLIANKILAWAATLLFGRRITDEATCYKMFRSDVLRSFDLKCRRFEFCPEVTAKTLKRGHRLVEVPIKYSGRSVESGKKIRARDGLEAIWALVRFRFSD
jgi:glycosyltransferase involved in cell wall biosynthesis